MFLQDGFGAAGIVIVFSKVAGQFQAFMLNAIVQPDQVQRTGFPEGEGIAGACGPAFI